MAIIYSYPYVSTVNNSDTLVISVSDTTADNGFLTKSLTADDLASYVTARVNLNFLGDTGTGIVNLDTQNLTVAGTTNQIDTVASAQTLTVSLPSTLVVPGTMQVVGTANFDSNVTIDIGLTVEDFFISNGNVRLLGPTPFGTTNTLTVNGNTTHNGKLTVTDHLVVTGSTPSTLNALTSLQVNGAADVSGVLTMENNIDMTLNGNIINLLNPVQAQDAATKAYVDGLVSGGLSFRGSFRADTGEILSGANTGSYLYNCPGGAGTRVAVSTGDYYIVANTSGNFYCSGDLLNIGDSIIAVADAAADTSTVNDWATLESDNIEGTGIANTIPLWTDSQVLGDSMLSQDAGATKVTISGALDLSSSLINNVLDPVAAQDAATKSYVDTQVATKVDGTGTTNTLPIWSDGPAGILGDSVISYDPTSDYIGIGTSNPTQKLAIEAGTGGGILVDTAQAGYLTLGASARTESPYATIRLNTGSGGTAVGGEGLVIGLGANEGQVANPSIAPSASAEAIRIPASNKVHLTELWKDNGSSSNDKYLLIGNDGEIKVGENPNTNVTSALAGTDYTLTFWTDGANRVIGDSTLIMTEVSPGAANPYSLKFGGGSVATGIRNSVAIGYETTSSGASSLSTGFQTTASGLHAASFNEGTTASGSRSAAFGQNTIASGSNCFAIGSGTTAATSLAFAGGLNSTANPSVNGTTAFAYGNALNVTGQNAAGFGQNNTVSGNKAFASGTNNTVSGTSAFVTGLNNTVSGNNSIVAGNNNSNISSNSFAVGAYNDGASFAKKLLIGEGLTALAQGQVTVLVGQYNATLSADTVFAVGSGSGTTGTPTTTQTAIAVKEGGAIIMEVLPSSTFSASNDAAADAIGVPAGGLYQNNGVVQVNRGGGSTTDPLAGGATSLNDLTDASTVKGGFNGGNNTENLILGQVATNLPNLDTTSSFGGNVILQPSASGNPTNLTSGYRNVLITERSGQALTTGSQNIAIGTGALNDSVTGNSSVAIGVNALSLNTKTGTTHNTAVGTGAGVNSTTGEKITSIGANSGWSSFPGTGSNITTIGYQAWASSSSASNEITLGNSSVTALRCAVTSITSLSDERDKKDITDLEYGLDFIESLQPKQFVWDNRTETAVTKDEEGNEITEEIHSANKGKKDFGFIAQEVQPLDNDVLRLVYDENPDKLEMSYGKLVPILVKAVKELSDKVKALENA